MMEPFVYGLKILFVIILLLFVAGVIGAYYKTPYKKSKSETGTKFAWPDMSKLWTISIQAIVVLILVATMVWLIFPEQIKTLSGNIKWLLIIAATALFIGSDPKKTITKGRIIASVVLITTLLLYLVWPAGKAKVVEYWPSGNPPAKEGSKPVSTKRAGAPGRDYAAKKTESPAKMQLPAGAKLVFSKLAPGKRVYLTRTNMDVPPPISWTQDASSGRVAKTESGWPADSRYFYVENDIARPINIYTVGAEATASLTKPTLTVARATTPATRRISSTAQDEECVLDAMFPR